MAFHNASLTDASHSTFLIAERDLYNITQTHCKSFLQRSEERLSETFIYSIGSHTEHLGTRSNGRFHLLGMSPWHSHGYSGVNRRLGSFDFTRETASLAQRTRRIGKEHALYHDHQYLTRTGLSRCLRVLQQRRGGEKSVYECYQDPCISARLIQPGHEDGDHASHRHHT